MIITVEVCNHRPPPPPPPLKVCDHNWLLLVYSILQLFFSLTTLAAFQRESCCTYKVYTTIVLWYCMCVLCFMWNGIQCPASCTCLVCDVGCFVCVMYVCSMFYVGWYPWFCLSLLFWCVMCDLCGCVPS